MLQSSTCQSQSSTVYYNRPVSYHNRPFQPSEEIIAEKVKAAKQLEREKQERKYQAKLKEKEDEINRLKETTSSGSQDQVRDIASNKDIIVMRKCITSSLTLSD